MHSSDRSGPNLETSRTRGGHRDLTVRILSSAMSVCTASIACLVLSGSLSAQAAAQSRAQTSALTTPWTIRFETVQAAMEGKFGPYYVEQTRRTYDPATQSFEGTLEHLTYRPADSQANTPSRFQLIFVGVEGRTLTPSQFARRSAEFAKRAGLTFSYKSFRVADATLAHQEYDIYFLARVPRSTQQGMRDVFRVVVYPKRADRTAWLLELDVRTGYPLYAGEYVVKQGGGYQKISELVVTSYQTGIRVPSAKDPGWWRPFKSIQAKASGLAAVQGALTKSKKFALPTNSHLPSGFQLEKSEIHTDPLSGDTSALLAYTDGVDRLFLMQQNTTFAARGADDVVFVLEDKGLTRCSFTHHGVSFQLVGRNVGGAVRDTTYGFYQHAVNVLR